MPIGHLHNLAQHNYCWGPRLGSPILLHMIIIHSLVVKLLPNTYLIRKEKEVDPSQKQKPKEIFININLQKPQKAGMVENYLIGIKLKSSEDFL